MNTFYNTILFTDTVVFYGICFIISSVITLFLYKYNKLSFIENFFIKKNLISSNANKKTNINFIVDDLISDLECSVVRYLSFYRNYNSNKNTTDIIPYIDNLLYILKYQKICGTEASLKEVKSILSKLEQNKIIDYYYESSKLLSWFKLLKELSCTNTGDTQFMEKYLRLYVPPIQQGTYDPSVDFPYYMNSYVIPKVKQLAEEAQQIINILRSKHIA
jgi:hypothetical protein